MASAGCSFAAEFTPHARKGYGSAGGRPPETRAKAPVCWSPAGYRQDSLNQVRTHLGPEQFGRAHATGMALSSGQALDLASRNALEPDLLA